MAEIPKRNVHVFSSSNGVEVAGFFQHGGISISMFVGWINQVCYVRGHWALYPSKFDNNHDVAGAALDSASDDELQPGRYIICTPPPESAEVMVYLTTDIPRTRAYSANDTDTAHETGFVNRIRRRDGCCCITGHLVVDEDYTGFEAAHIFPLNETDVWNHLNFKRFITDDKIAPGFEMNSAQQGFLCSSTEHCMFIDYSIGVNPDVRLSFGTFDFYHNNPLQDGYRICDFVGRDPRRSPHGNLFYRNPDEDPRYLPSAHLLRDHFRQCILRRIKGAGGSDNIERRFNPDIDLHDGAFNLAAGGWWSGKEGKKQLEAELAARLWGAVAAGNKHCL